MVVITNRQLERMLLHSFATSISSPVRERKIPFRWTGSPTARNSKVAIHADPCWSHPTITFNTTPGTGTSKNKKQRGNRKDRKARWPKQNTTLAIHQVTRVNMASDGRTSSDAALIPHLA